MNLNAPAKTRFRFQVHTLWADTVTLHMMAYVDLHFKRHTLYNTHL
jgi:hypothetical protein